MSGGRLDAALSKIQAWVETRRHVSSLSCEIGADAVHACAYVCPRPRRRCRVRALAALSVAAYIFRRGRRSAGPYSGLGTGCGVVGRTHLMRRRRRAQLEEDCVHAAAFVDEVRDGAPASSAASVVARARRGPRGREAGSPPRVPRRRTPPTARAPSSRAPQRQPRRRPRRSPLIKADTLQCPSASQLKRRAPPRRARQSPCPRRVRGPACRGRGTGAFPESAPGRRRRPNTRPGAALAVAELARDFMSAHITSKPSHAAVHHVVEAWRPAAPRRPPPRRLSSRRSPRRRGRGSPRRVRIRGPVVDERRAPRVGRGGQRDRGVASLPSSARAAAAAARSRGLVGTRRAATRRRKWEVETSPGAAAASSTRRGPHHNSSRRSPSYSSPRGSRLGSPRRGTLNFRRPTHRRDGGSV